MAYRGDTVIIGCDTVFLFNKVKIDNCKDILATYEDYVQLLEARIAEQDAEYSQLRQLNQSLMDSSLFYINKTDRGMLAVRDSVDKSISYINTTMQDIKDLKKEIRKNSREGKILWGTSGFFLGALLSVIVF